MWVISLAAITLICTATAQECVDSGGIYLLGNTFPCSHLLNDVQPQWGIYAKRGDFCNKEPVASACCKSCEQVLKCSDDYIRVAESPYSCKYLLKFYPEDEKVGIYKGRHYLCERTTTECCKNCDIVRKQPKPTTTTKVTEKPTTVVTVAPLTEELIDTCTVNCLWIADGAQGTCSWLTDRNSEAFQIRKMLCRQGLAQGCARSCQIVNNEGPTTPEIHVTDAPSTVAPTPKPEGCSDSEYIRVGRIPYQCTDLVNMQSNIYTNRESLCNDARIRGECCASCIQVDNMKPGVVRYGENTVLKSSSENIEIVQPEAAAQTSDQSPDIVISYDDALKRMEQKQREAVQKVQDAMLKAMQEMFAWFKSIKND